MRSPLRTSYMRAPRIVLPGIYACVAATDRSVLAAERSRTPRHLRPCRSTLPPCSCSTFCLRSCYFQSPCSVIFILLFYCCDWFADLTENIVRHCGVTFQASIKRRSQRNSCPRRRRAFSATTASHSTTLAAGILITPTTPISRWVISLYEINYVNMTQLLIVYPTLYLLLFAKRITNIVYYGFPIWILWILAWFVS